MEEFRFSRFGVVVLLLEIASGNDPVVVITLILGYGRKPIWSIGIADCIGGHLKWKMLRSEAARLGHLTGLINW